MDEEKGKEAVKDGVIRMGVPIIDMSAFTKTTEEFVKGLPQQPEKNERSTTELLTEALERRKEFSRVERVMLENFQREVKRLKDGADRDIEKGGMTMELKESMYKGIDTLVLAYEHSLDSPIDNLTACLGLVITIFLKQTKDFEKVISLLERFSLGILMQKLGRGNEK
jgi:hypothetical protein